jgi:hypothetical protein
LKSSVCFDSSSPPWTNRQVHTNTNTQVTGTKKDTDWCDFLIHVYRKNSRIKCTVVLIKIRSNEWTHSSKLHAIVHPRTHTNTHTRMSARTHAHLHLEAAVFIDANVRFIRSEIRARRKRHVKACSGDVCPIGGEGNNYKILFLIFHLI